MSIANRTIQILDEMLILNLPVIVLLIVFLLIALRGVLSVRVSIWQAKVGGAVVVLLSGDITP